MNATIRAARPDDLAAIGRLLRDAELPLAGVEEALADFVVAEDAGQLVGVAGIEVCCENALLRSVAVRESVRGHGLGRALVTHAIARAESRGVHALYLLTTTAEQYFPSFGFAPVSRDEVPDDVRATEEFRVACPASAVVMERGCCTPGSA